MKSTIFGKQIFVCSAKAVSSHFHLTHILSHSLARSLTHVVAVYYYNGRRYCVFARCCVCSDALSLMAGYPAPVPVCVCVSLTVEPNTYIHYTCRIPKIISARKSLCERMYYNVRRSLLSAPHKDMQRCRCAHGPWLVYSLAIVPDNARTTKYIIVELKSHTR